MCVPARFHAPLYHAPYFRSMEYKTCTKCHRSLAIVNFPYRNKKIGRRHENCRPCRNAYHVQRYHKHIDENRRRDLQRRQAYRDLKAGKCTDCGVSYPPYVMDFDHREPVKKSFNITTGASMRMGIARLLREIEKCDLVCSNCHREREYGPNGRSRSKLWSMPPLPKNILPIQERLAKQKEKEAVAEIRTRCDPQH